jgi:hypothetical protein
MRKGVRYVDDLRGCLCFAKNCFISKRRAEEILGRLKNSCYPEGLVLEEEKIENGSCKFLKPQQRSQETE